MSSDDWNWRLPSVLQTSAWSCSAASLAWALSAWGYPATESECVAGLGPARINPTSGLLDATGSGIVSYLSELGVPAMNNPACSWTDLTEAAGSQPMLIGGRNWNHWSGVRTLLGPDPHDPKNMLYLANPAPGWMDIWNFISLPLFEQLGVFSAVWFPAA